MRTQHTWLLAGLAVLLAALAACSSQPTGTGSSTYGSSGTGSTGSSGTMDYETGNVTPGTQGAMPAPGNQSGMHQSGMMNQSGTSGPGMTGSSGMAGQSAVPGQPGMSGQAGMAGQRAMDQQAGMAGQRAMDQGMPQMGVVARIETMQKPSTEQGTSSYGSSGSAATGSSAASNTVYRVTVRMDDGSVREIIQEDPPRFRIGDAVAVANGAIRPR